MVVEQMSAWAEVPRPRAGPPSKPEGRTMKPGRIREEWPAMIPDGPGVDSPSRRGGSSACAPSGDPSS